MSCMGDMVGMVGMVGMGGLNHLTIGKRLSAIGTGTGTGAISATGAIRVVCSTCKILPLVTSWKAWQMVVSKVSLRLVGCCCRCCCSSIMRINTEPSWVKS